MEKEQKKKVIFPIIALIVAAILVVALGTYAYWQITRKQTNRNVVGTACLDITFGNESNDILLENAWPTSDSDGASLTPYTFTITNTCDTPVNYTVALESVADQSANNAYLDYNYIRVKLDSEGVKTYGALTGLTNDSNPGYSLRDTKEITHHTLAANESVTHNLRLWVKEDTPLQNSDESLNTDKFFFGKIKIIAGQNIEGDEPSFAKLVLLSDQDEPYVTPNNIQIGDRVGIENTNEEFYVIGINGNDVKLLARYKINVGTNVNPNATEGLQSSQLGYTKSTVDAEEATAYDNNFGAGYGDVSFSETTYWLDSYSNFINEYGPGSYVYNDESNLKEYVDGYVETLENMSVNVTSGTILSLEDFGTLCNNNSIIDNEDVTNCPNFLFESSYWLGNIVGNSWDYSKSHIYYASGYASCLDYGAYENNYGVGIRPVINVTLS